MISRKRKSGKLLARAQGATLLEVLVSVLIFSCGMLAIAGLQARAFKHSGDVQYRAEAIHAVNAYVGKIKAMTPSAAAGGASQVENLFHAGEEFTRFKGELLARLPGAGEPVVSFITDPNLPTGTRLVDVTVTWQPPGEETVHRYTQTSVIGNN